MSNESLWRWWLARVKACVRRSSEPEPDPIIDALTLEAVRVPETLLKKQRVEVEHRQAETRLTDAETRLTKEELRKRRVDVEHRQAETRRIEAETLRARVETLRELAAAVKELREAGFDIVFTDSGELKITSLDIKAP